MSKSQLTNPKSDINFRCYNFSIKIIKFLDNLPNKRVYWIISDQLLRSATSIGANIIEAKSSLSKRDFIKFYEISLKSANESKYWLGLLRDATELDISDLLLELEEISRMLGASVITLKNKR
ncbi:MAG: four helix bundle protein [Candidatus Colwellbacteria bacterium]|nr:four helix bundle protein [Candidatus Colwellbacteria bacterium]